jgi:hypothetical protein
LIEPGALHNALHLVGAETDDVVALGKVVGRVVFCGQLQHSGRGGGGDQTGGAGGEGDRSNAHGQGSLAEVEINRASSSAPPVNARLKKNFDYMAN